MQFFNQQISMRKIIIILIVVALGLLIINQFIAYNKKVNLLMAPCELCLKENPHYYGCLLIKESQNEKEYWLDVNLSYPVQSQPLESYQTQP
jgi:hypothetical protein